MRVKITGKPGGYINLDDHGYATLRDKKHVVLYEPPPMKAVIEYGDDNAADEKPETVTLVKIGGGNVGFSCFVSAGDVTKLSRWKPPGLTKIELDALSNVSGRMKIAEPYKDIWSAEFIVIEMLITAIQNGDDKKLADIINGFNS